MHSLFGASKAAADLLVQEYGRYFGMPTVCLRGGCLTGPNHAGTMLHGFLSYLMRCTVDGESYGCSGTGGSRSATTSTAPTWSRRAWRSIVRPARRPCTTSAVAGRATARCWRRSRSASGSPARSCRGSSTSAAAGDHRWWISDLDEFRADYPEWRIRYGVEQILREIYEFNAERWAAPVS